MVPSLRLCTAILRARRPIVGLRRAARLIAGCTYCVPRVSHCADRHRRNCTPPSVHGTAGAARSAGLLARPCRASTSRSHSQPSLPAFRSQAWNRGKRDTSQSSKPSNMAGRLGRRPPEREHILIRAAQTGSVISGVRRLTAGARSTPGRGHAGREGKRAARRGKTHPRDACLRTPFCGAARA